MKRLIQILGSVTLMVLMISANAQKIDLTRMDRDIEVAENVLQTLVKQQFENQRMFFTLEVDGSYQEGFGVTFRLPPDFTTPFAYSFSVSGDEGGDVVIMDGNAVGGGVYTYTKKDREDRVKVEIEEDNMKAKERAKPMKRRVDMDSVRGAYNARLIEAAKSFIVDYSELITQLGANERIMVTNQGDQPRVWVNRYFSSAKRTHLSVDASKADLSQYKQGKINRDQMLAKVNVLSTETEEVVEPDLELLSSIFTRLYRSDLSKTYFSDDGIYYERLKNFGAVYYMRVYSSNQSDIKLYSMPTVGLDGVDQATRDKKAKELYPAFEKELKENMVEYGRTLRSLKDEELLIFNVKLTKCLGCGIPSSLELSVKGSVLKDYSAGKITKEAAADKLMLKKGQNQ